MNSTSAILISSFLLHSEEEGNVRSCYIQEENESNAKKNVLSKNQHIRKYPCWLEDIPLIKTALIPFVAQNRFNLKNNRKRTPNTRLSLGNCRGELGFVLDILILEGLDGKCWLSELSYRQLAKILVDEETFPLEPMIVNTRFGWYISAAPSTVSETQTKFE